MSFARSADLPSRSENAIFILFDNLSTADYLKLPLGTEALARRCNQFRHLEYDHDIASCNPTNNIHNARIFRVQHHIYCPCSG
jgi:hypothetical protein